MRHWVKTNLFATGDYVEKSSRPDCEVVAGSMMLGS